jgi:hypothetical protein
MHTANPGQAKWPSSLSTVRLPNNLLPPEGIRSFSLPTGYLEFFEVLIDELHVPLSWYNISKTNNKTRKFPHIPYPQKPQNNISNYFFLQILESVKIWIFE